MKKLLLMFVGIVCSLMAMAGNYGFSSSITGTTVSAPAVTNTDGITVTIERGSKTQTGSGKGSMFWGSTTALTFSGAAERTQYNPGTGNVALPIAFVDDVWTGAKFVIPEGKVLKATKIYIEAAGQDYKWHYKVSVVNGDGTVVNTPSNKGGSSPKAASKLSVTDNFTADLTGKVYVKVHFYNETSSNSKYFAIPVLTLTGTLEDAPSQTQYQKPSFSAGAYDKVSGTYPVTITANDNDAVVNYTVGSDAKVTGVASGTVINVAPNTKVVATVSGSAYTESDEQTFTTAAAPKVATPTYAIGTYSFVTNMYQVTLNSVAGSTVRYKINNGEWNTYESAFTAPVKAVIDVEAMEEHMTTSDPLSFEIPLAPTGGIDNTPTTAGTYTDGMTYNAGAFTIPSTNSYIGGQISSGTSTINGAIKMRISRNADPAGSQDSKYGFHILVNPGNILNEVKIDMLNNYNTKIALVGIYVDNATENLLAEPVALPYAAKDVAKVTAKVEGIAAKQKVVFVFDKTEGTDNPNQAQILIETVSAPDMNIELSTNSKGFATFSCACDVKIEGAKVYVAKLDLENNKIIAKEVENGEVPGGAGVLLAGKPNAKVTASYMETGIFFPSADNDLLATTVAGGSIATKVPSLVLSGDTFVKFSGDAFTANKAYFPYEVAAAGKPLAIVFEDSEATQNDAAVVEEQKELKGKFIQNGKLVIINGAKKTSVAGYEMK